MSTKVWWQPDGSPVGEEIDLSKCPEVIYEEIASLRHQLDNDNSILTCLGNGKPMYIAKKNGRYFATHFPGDNTDGHTHPISKMSDEHRRQVDYLARAAQADGLAAIPEFSTGQGTRLDLAVRGGDLDIGLEVQRSQLSRRAAQGRTTRSSKAGFVVAWTHDQEEGKKPGWVDYVPTARLSRQGVSDWERGTPPPGAAKAIIRKVDRIRDGLRWRYEQGPSIMALDDLPASMAAGEIVPVRIGTRGKVILAHREAAEVLESVTYPGASKWTPSAETREYREAAQRYTTECHPSSPTHSPAVDVLADPDWDSPPATAQPTKGLWSRTCPSCADNGGWMRCDRLSDHWAEG